MEDRHLKALEAAKAHDPDTVCLSCGHEAKYHSEEYGCDCGSMSLNGGRMTFCRCRTFRWAAPRPTH